LKKQIDKSFRDLKEWIFTFRGGLTIFSLILIVAFPLITMNNYFISIIVTSLVFSIFAASWDLLAGIAGQTSFGHAIFFAISGYTTAAFMKALGVNWFLSMLLGATIGVLAGLIIGIPCLRLKGPYLSLATQAFCLILFNLFMLGSLKDILGSTEGISGLDIVFTEPIVAFFFFLIIMIISFVCMTLVSKSNVGTIFRAIRDDETGAEASGINTTKYKLLVFMISGFFAGIAGALFTINYRGINPAAFQPLYSFYALVIVAIGGIATIAGSIPGAFLFVILGEIFRPLGEFAVLLFALFLILVIRFAERGLLDPLLEHLKDFYDFIRRR
jgi:branched-chain amino acid transport system permease protein